MSRALDCPACMTGDHEGHNRDWNIKPGLIGGEYCDCTGDCAERSAAAFAASPFGQLTTGINQLVARGYVCRHGLTPNEHTCDPMLDDAQQAILAAHTPPPPAEEDYGPGCDCTELCSMGPTCPGGMLAGLPGSGCWRTPPAPADREGPYDDRLVTCPECRSTFEAEDGTVVADREGPAGGLSEGEREALWEAIERAFLDTTTYSRESEDEIERAVERILATRLAAVRAPDAGLRARVEALADEWTHATCQTDGAPCSWHRVSAECADELLAALAADDGGEG